MKHDFLFCFFDPHVAVRLQVCQRTASMPLRIVIRSVEEDSGFVFPRLEDSKNDEITMKRESCKSYCTYL